MQPYHATAGRGDGRLWTIAALLSVPATLLIVLLIIAGFSVVEIASVLLRLPKPPVALEKPAQEVTVQIYPEMVRPTAAAPAVAAPAPPPPVITPPAPRKTVRTSEEQRGKRPDKPAFIGERDTAAASDRAPDASAPPLPSQKGIEPKNEGDLETTESRFREGAIPELNQPNTQAPALPEGAPPAPAVAESTPAIPPAPDAPEDAIRSLPLEKLVEGPNPVDVPVQESPKTKPDTKEAKRSPPAQPEQKKRDASPPTARKQAINDPAFSGYQRKTAIRGSISRTGVSALDVEDTPLGRYQSVISRAVEQEWQRNCARYRDLITPGYLTIRFYVETSGRVRSVQFVDGFTGENQKGFTLNSIRNAEIPPMPASLRKDYEKQPLEFIFNFYF